METPFLHHVVSLTDAVPRSALQLTFTDARMSGVVFPMLFLLREDRTDLDF